MMPSLKHDPRNPGLSRQLLDLETRLGLPLFRRLGKRMVPTTAGERLLVAARRTITVITSPKESRVNSRLGARKRA